MAFESLFFKPMSELELIDLMVAQVQARFTELRGKFYYLKVDLVNAEQSQIVWEKELLSRAALKDFFYDSKNVRSFLGLRFDEDKFEAFMSGFCVSARFQIYPDRMVMGPHPSIHECNPNKEKHPMITRELLEGGFGDLVGQFEKRSNNRFKTQLKML